MILPICDTSVVFATSPEWIEGWRQTQSMKTPRAGAAIAQYKNYVYILGGVDGRQFLSSVEMATLSENAEVLSWRLTTPLPTKLGFMAALVHEGYLYVVGGGSGPNGKILRREVLRAKIRPDGSLGAWRDQSPLLLPRRCAKLATHNDRLYAIGGFGGTLLDSVEVADFTQSGLGPWKMESEHLIEPRYVHGVKVVGDKILALGGHHQQKGVGINTVEWMSPGSGGSRWVSTHPLNQGRYGHGSAFSDNHLFVFGGISGTEYLNSVEVASVGEKFEIFPFHETTPLPYPMANFAVAVYNKHLLIIGGTTFNDYLNKVLISDVDSKGSIGFWGEKSDRFQPAVAQKSALVNTGIISELLQTTDYSYIRVTMPSGQEIWLASPVLSAQIGQTIHFSQGVQMSGFFSKTLKRKFDTILFVSVVQAE